MRSIIASHSTLKDFEFVLTFFAYNIVLSELWLYDNEIIHTRGGIIALQVPSLRGTRGAIIPPQVWIISLSYNQS